jgi:transcriptional regulator with XRE-family HTH domain
MFFAETKVMKGLRASRGVTQEQLGREVGIDQPAVSYIETGRRPARLNQAQAIARALNCDLLVLFRGPDSQ